MLRSYSLGVASKLTEDNLLLLKSLLALLQNISRSVANTKMTTKPTLRGTKPPGV